MLRYNKSKEEIPYDYNAKPDGEDVAGKLVHVLKPTATIAFFLGTADVLLYSHPKGYLQTLGRYAYVGAPLLGATTTFVCTSNIIGSLRNKDDELNWFLGGLAAGAIFGIWRRRTIVGFNMGMFLGIIGLIRKNCLLNGYAWGPDEIKTRGTVWSFQQDYTLTRERPGNWTTGS
ncbi:hypothetical protein NQ317_008765 [Molorchus minor]|uniref:NADH dehydrogenase [ubiquinone] 1 alpha subcomplex subunit 11 n=1 Tax=Molorchus minor TaxID=1323400 RepID=A0ABQ9J348_9CUCU|nr:hypothetical protein NQ317_008765 [Molorchus minor]